MQRQFSLILLPVLFLLHFKIDEGFACGVQVYDDFGCTDLNSTVVPGGNCGPNNGDCVVCRFIFKRNCQIKTECSCFYCCNPKYAENCPDGCNDCVWDGKGDKACRESKNVQFYGCAKYFAKFVCNSGAKTLTKNDRQTAGCNGCIWLCQSGQESKPRMRSTWTDHLSEKREKRI